MNQRNSAPRIASSMLRLAFDMGASSSTGVSTAAICSPRSISLLSSFASLFSLIVLNSTSAEMTISTEAMRKGSSMVQMLRSAAGALMYFESTKNRPSTVAKAPPK